MALIKYELKNDALLDVLYELVGRKYRSSGSFAFYLFYGSYDIPSKGSDLKWQGESEEIYSFLIGTICKVDQSYYPEKPKSGFLFPTFKDRSGDCQRIHLFQNSGDRIEKLFLP